MTWRHRPDRAPACVTALGACKASAVAWGLRRLAAVYHVTAVESPPRSEHPAYLCTARLIRETEDRSALRSTQRPPGDAHQGANHSRRTAPPGARARGSLAVSGLDQRPCAGPRSRDAPRSGGEACGVWRSAADCPPWNACACLILPGPPMLSRKNAVARNHQPATVVRICVGATGAAKPRRPSPARARRRTARAVSRSELIRDAEDDAVRRATPQPNSPSTRGRDILASCVAQNSIRSRSSTVVRVVTSLTSRDRCIAAA